jgi:hypothetical protein
MKTLTVLLLAFTLVSCKAQNQIDNLDNLVITKTSLAELCSSNDEVECFSHYFDTKPEIIKENLNAYRVKYSSELRDKGWNPTSPFDLINFRVPFDKNGYIISWETFKRLHSIDNDNSEKTLFHYEIED